VGSNLQAYIQHSSAGKHALHACMTCSPEKKYTLQACKHAFTEMEGSLQACKVCFPEKEENDLNLKSHIDNKTAPITLAFCILILLNILAGIRRARTTSSC